MRTLLAILLALPLAGQVAIEPVVKDPVPTVAAKIYEVPADWTTVKRPTLAVTVAALKTERTAGECQDCLHISEPGVYQDAKGVTWYVINHPRPGTVAVQDKALFAEISRCPKFVDGEHDELWIVNYLRDLAVAGTVKYWREKPAVYDKDGKIVTPAIPLIPLDWHAVGSELEAQ